MALDSRPLLVSIDLPFGGTNLEENLMSHTGLAASELSHMSHVTYCHTCHTLSHMSHIITHCHTLSQGLQPARTGRETADQVVWLEGPQRGRRMPNIKVLP